jgi:hypothetical protein
MRKVKSTVSFRLGQHVIDFKDVFTSEGEAVFCQACGESSVVNGVLKLQYSNGGRHVTAAVRLQIADTDSLIGQTSATRYSLGPSKFSTFATGLRERRE